jgi:hypothetical protein
MKTTIQVLIGANWGIHVNLSGISYFVRRVDFAKRAEGIDASIAPYLYVHYW